MLFFKSIKDCKKHFSDGKLTGRFEVTVNKMKGVIYVENGEFHRTDGPAIDWLTGLSAWHRHGKLHRTDGPAVQYLEKTEYWIDGEGYYDMEEYKIATRRYKLESFLEDEKDGNM